MALNTLKPAPGSKRSSRRLGRGFTRGKTCGRGHKGQKSRSGASIPAAFEGGQNPLPRRLPKRGFNTITDQVHQEVKLYAIQAVITKLALKKPVIDLEFLKTHKVIKASVQSVKIILSGELSSAVTVCTCTKTIGKTDYDLIRITAGARSAIEASGGIIKATKITNSEANQV